VFRREVFTTERARTPQGLFSLYTMELLDDLTARNEAGSKRLQPHTVGDQFLVEVDEVSDDHLQVIKHTLDGFQVRGVWRQPDEGYAIILKNLVARRVVDWGVIKEKDTVGGLKVSRNSGGVAAQSRQQPAEKEKPIMAREGALADDGVKPQELLVGANSHGRAYALENTRVQVPQVEPLMSERPPTTTEHVPSVRVRLINGDDAPRASHLT